MKEKLLASAALVLLACTPAMAQGLDDVKHKFASVSGIVQDKCMACHSRGYDLPFYAKVPGISAIIEKDYRDGIRAMDLNQELVQRKDRPVGETVLAKMEWVILNDTMPPAKFAVVHWGSRLSDQDKKDILTWVAQTRKAHYATDAAPEHANEPIQPIPHRLPVDEAKVALGKTLFNDARLSADSTVACATCHAMDKAGTDNARFSEGIRKQLGDVNAPTTFNAVFNFVQFWDGRAADLQEQAGGPPLNPIEMGSKDWDEIVARLAADAELTAKFRAVYPDGWSGKNITNAIAEYEKTLISPDSRFDRWLRGDKSALTAAEVEGYERFKAYRCASCHVGKSMGRPVLRISGPQEGLLRRPRRQAPGFRQGPLQRQRQGRGHAPLQGAQPAQRGADPSLSARRHRDHSGRSRAHHGHLLLRPGRAPEGPRPHRGLPAHPDRPA